MPALETPPVQLGWKAPDFRLKGTDAKFYTPTDVTGDKGLLVMFICNHCPFVQAIADKIAQVTHELKNSGIGSVAIMSNDTTEYPEDSFENMVAFKAKHHFYFPYLIDETQSIARAYDAVCTPDFFGFGAGLTLQYRGRLDSSGTKRIADAKQELLEAMKQVAATGKAPTQQNPSIGRSIKWRDAA